MYFDLEYSEGNISYMIISTNNDILDNKNIPTITYYYQCGNIESEFYYINDQLHNGNGPAVIHYSISGKIESQYYYLYGKEFNSLKELQDYNKTLLLK